MLPDAPKLCRLVPPFLGASRSLRTGRLQWLRQGADSRAGELATTSVVVPCVTLCLGEAGQGTEASRGKQLPLSLAPSMGRGISLRYTHLRIRTADPPPGDQLEEEGKNKFLITQCWKAPGEIEEFIVYRTRGDHSFFFPFSSTTCFYIRL